MANMLKIILFTLLAFQLGVHAKKPCNSACPRIFAPICATNGNKFKYFHNECLMDYESCRTEQAWRPTRLSHCLQQVKPTPENHSCLRACQFIYAPVCAMNINGALEVFGNKCVFEIENCLANGEWKLIREEQCGLSSDN